jgi:hypothetical protein
MQGQGRAGHLPTEGATKQVASKQELELRSKRIDVLLANF